MDVDPATYCTSLVRMRVESFVRGASYRGFYGFQPVGRAAGLLCGERGG